ncbi:MAG: TolC family protein, partial [Planctomycetota bacterium]
HAAAAFVLALAACASLDPGADRQDMRDDLAQRLRTKLPDTPAGDLDPTINDVVANLLQTPLTEDSAVHIALLNNHSVRAAYERLGIARADLVQAGLLRNPVFDGDARFLFGGGTDLELGLAQPFLDLFYRPLRERLAEHEFTAARLLVTDDLVHLVFSVRRAFVQLRSAQQLVELHQRALVAAEAAHELAVELHAAGNLTSQALARERIGETRMRLDLAAAEQAAHEAHEPLHDLLGLWGPHTAWTIEGGLSDDVLASVDTNDIEARAVAASLELAAQRARLDGMAQHAKIESWRGWFPSGEAGLTALREPDGDWGLGPHLALELPVFDGGDSRQAKAAASLRQGLHEHVQLAVRVRSAARLLRDRARQLADRARFLREVHLPQRAEVVRTTLQHYNAMQIGIFDVLLEKQQQLADGREYVLTLRLAHLARLDLQTLLAGSLPADALQPMQPSTSYAPADSRKPGH